VQIGLHVSSFTWPGGSPALRTTLVRVATTAEEQGFAKLSVMVPWCGRSATWTTRAGDAGGLHGARVSSPAAPNASNCWPGSRPSSYRDPGLLAKAVTTWTCCQAVGRGSESARRGTSRKREASDCSFPPLAERFERLEEALQICSADVGRRRRPLTRAGTISSNGPSTAPPSSEPSSAHRS